MVGAPSEEWGEQVAAFVVLADLSAPPGHDELLAFAAERLAGFKRPRVVHYVEALPRNALGKVSEARAAAMSGRDGGLMGVDLDGRAAVVTGGASGIGERLRPPAGRGRGAGDRGRPGRRRRRAGRGRASAGSRWPPI